MEIPFPVFCKLHKTFWTVSALEKRKPLFVGHCYLDCSAFQGALDTSQRQRKGHPIPQGLYDLKRQRQVRVKMLAQVCACSFNEKQHYLPSVLSIHFSHFSEGFPVWVLTYLPTFHMFKSYEVKHISLQWSIHNISLVLPSANSSGQSCPSDTPNGICQVLGVAVVYFHE